MTSTDQAFQYVMDRRVPIALLAIGVTTILLWRSRRKHYNLPPGPTPLPLVGNILELSKETFTCKLFVEMAKKYGPIFKIRIGMIDAVVLNSVEAIRDSFLKRQNDFAGRPEFYSMTLFGEMDKTITFGDFTPAWALQRKIAHTSIRKYASGKHLEELIHYSFDNISEILHKQKEPLDPRKLISLLVFNIIAVMCFGKRFELDDPFFLEMIELNEKGTEALGNGTVPDFLPFLAPLWRILPNKSSEILTTFSTKFSKFLEDTLDEHEKNFDPDNVTDLTYHVIHDIKEMQNDKSQSDVMSQMSRVHFINILFDMFFAGTDTSRFTLTWIVQFMAQSPHVQEKMQKEVDEVVGHGRQVLMSDRVKLPYCEAVMYEVSRLRPPATLAIPHKTLCDTTVGGYDIPAGYQVLPNLWALHMDPEFWEKPEEFCPERFLDDKGQLLPKPDNFLPFSTGRRVCVGEALAKTEIHLITAMLAQKFSFHPVPGEKLEGKMLGTGLGCIPAHFRIMVKPRQTD